VLFAMLRFAVEKDDCTIIICSEKHKILFLVYFVSSE
jgi:hypothetical protein